jgi:Trk K+ transport system NAD-binding subunit
MSISRNGEKIIPHGNTVLEYGDLVMLVGSREPVLKTIRLIGII